jgi:hypothetical protein
MRLVIDVLRRDVHQGQVRVRDECLLAMERAWRRMSKARRPPGLFLAFLARRRWKFSGKLASHGNRAARKPDRRIHLLAIVEGILD